VAFAALLCSNDCLFGSGSFEDNPSVSGIKKPGKRTSGRRAKEDLLRNIKRKKLQKNSNPWKMSYLQKCLSCRRRRRLLKKLLKKHFNCLRERDSQLKEMLQLCAEEQQRQLEEMRRLRAHLYAGIPYVETEESSDYRDAKATMDKLSRGKDKSSQRLRRAREGVKRMFETNEELRRAYQKNKESERFFLILDDAN
jgi:hypothetical protein